MISNEQKIRLGVFLVISFLVLALILAVLIVPKLREEGDTYYINFKGTSVNGVNEGAPVKYQGVKIGKVSGLEVNPDNLNSVLIYLRIKKDFPVKEDMRATLQYAGITGMRFVEISGGKKKTSFVLPGGEIKTKKGLGEKAEDIVLNVDSVVDAVNKMLNAENREKIALMLKNLETSTGVIAKVLENRQGSVDGSLEKLDKAMVHIVTLSENLKILSQRLNEMSGEISVKNLAKESETLLRNLSERFSKNEMGRVITQMDSFLQTATTSMLRIEGNFNQLQEEFRITMSGLRESVENIGRFTRQLSEDPTMLIRKQSDRKRSKK